MDEPAPGGSEGQGRVCYSSDEISSGLLFFSIEREDNFERNRYKGLLSKDNMDRKERSFATEDIGKIRFSEKLKLIIWALNCYRFFGN